jgi:hypothetical protein
VFAVSNSVSIYSNGFNFALDKRRQLGLLNPTIIEELHPKARPGWMLFVLGLGVSDDEYHTVKTCLEEIRPEILLFTHRLQEIEVTFREANIHRYSNNPRNTIQTWKYHMKLEEDDPQIYTITSTGAQSQSEVRYFRQELEVPDMPNHSSRIGITESKIVLAFPFDTDNHPIILEQNIFAFMPLHKTQFPVHPSFAISDKSF